MIVNKPKLLLFDLGGVIVPWVGFEALAASNGLSREAVAAKFEQSEICSAYERGRVDDDIFLKELGSLFDLETHDIASLWNSWVLPPFPGVIKALEHLKSEFTIACLSNTNALHWIHLNEMFEIDIVFHHAFASHHIHAAKPDAQSYQIVLDTIGVEAEDVWFFEDTTVNVNAASDLGMIVHQINRTDGVLSTLKRLSLIS